MNGSYLHMLCFFVCCYCVFCRFWRIKDVYNIQIAKRNETMKRNRWQFFRQTNSERRQRLQDLRSPRSWLLTPRLQVVVSMSSLVMLSFARWQPAPARLTRWRSASGVNDFKDLKTSLAGVHLSARTPSLAWPCAAAAATDEKLDLVERASDVAKRGTITNGEWQPLK